MDPNYKVLHEQFVSNSSGTTPEEINLISLSIPLSLLVLAFTFKSSSVAKNSFSWCLLEFVCISVPLILSLTTFSDLLACVIVTLILLALGGWLVLQFKNQVQNGSTTTSAAKLPFITNYRSGMLLVTAVCILGVDFPVYPRRFAKTETFGFGLMDIGVGSFIFANGLVSQEARKSLKDGSCLSYLKKSLLSSCPLLILGILRFVSIKSTGYHEHVTEYGLHWNFFFTLATTKIFSSLLLGTVLPVSLCWTASILLSICSEALLISGLQEWVFTPDSIGRDQQDFLTANREGLVSSIGYLAIYLAGVGWGRHLVEKSNTVKEKAKQLGILVLWSGLMWASMFYSQNELFEPPSRRLANWNFFNWMVAYNLFLLALFLGSDILVITINSYSLLRWKSNEANQRKLKGSQKTKKSKPNQGSSSSLDSHGWSPYLFDAISFNALAYFLLANLLTGAVNFSVQTVHVGDRSAVAVLTCYAFVLHFAIVGLFKMKFKIKVW